jgi:hypothetical protein
MPCLQCIQQRHALALAAAVVDFIGDAQGLGASRHGRNRRDADAAGDENQLLRAFVELEVVARAAHLHLHAGLQCPIQAEPPRLCSSRSTAIS